MSKLKYFSMALPLIITACSDFPDNTDMLGGFGSQQVVEGVNNVVLLKLAYQDVVKKWHVYKAGFDMSKVKDERSRQLVHNAAKSIDDFLAKIKSVREQGSVVDKALIIADIALFREKLAKAHDDLGTVYILYSDNLTEEKRKQYFDFLEDLKAVSLKEYVGGDDSSKLAQHLYDILKAAKAINSLR